MSTLFPPRPSDKSALEEGTSFTPKFDENGLIPCITLHAETGAVLMFAYMNEISLAKTLETGFIYYWSRSRGKLWFKGEESGMTQKVVQLLTDCDQDCLVARVIVGASTVGGVQASCHTGRDNCFYREIPTGPGAAKDMKIVLEKTYDVSKVYGKH